MDKDYLIAEISDDNIRYLIYKFDEKSNYKSLSRKISKNSGIKKGKIVDFDFSAKKINDDIKHLEKESNKTFKNISLVINEPEISSINLSGFKKLKGSKVDKRDLEYILNEAQISISQNNKQNSILHIINSYFILDKIKKNKIPLNLHGDHLTLHMTFISLPKNNLKNIKALFDKCDLKIERIIAKPLACGINLLNKRNKNKDFLLINLDKEFSSISFFEESSLVFTKIFPFGTNSIINDIGKLCSINENEVRLIISKIDFTSTINTKDYIDKNLFKESKFKKLSIKHVKDIINARIIEMLDYLFNKNRNLKYLNEKILSIDIFFEDKEVLRYLGKLFHENLRTGNMKTQIELMHLDDFFALSGAAELIFKGWDKEAIPLNKVKKSVISRFFERFF
tara:strand:+ start:5956 stop:7143 length:1188 start_codon:yes stop_codon:yes gene_type:complete